jgi:hypothetical protein
LTGKQNFTMMVCSSTDGLTTKEDNTAVIIKDQFQERHNKNKTHTNFIAWKNIYSRVKSGKMLVSSQ